MLFFGAGFLTGRSRAEKQSYARGFDNGYTDGYNASPVFRRNTQKIATKGGSDAGNMAVAGGAFAAQSEGSLFYITDGGIRRMSENGMENELIIQNTDVSALSYRNGWLYYSSGDMIMQTSIYTLDSDILSEEVSGELFVAEDLFYIRGRTLFHLLDVKTGETTALEDLPSRCKSLNTDGENLYFIGETDHALYRSGTTGNRPTKMAKERLIVFACSKTISSVQSMTAIRRVNQGRQNNG